MNGSKLQPCVEVLQGLGMETSAYIDPSERPMDTSNLRHWLDTQLRAED